MQLTELIARVRSNMSELDSTGFYSDEDIKSWLNKAQHNIAVLTKHLEEKDDITITAGVGDIPEDCIEIFMVEKGGKRLGEVALEVKGFYTGYYEWDDKIYITPNDYSGDVTLYYFRAPEEMSADTDEAEVPDEFLETLVIYALFRACQKDDKLNHAQMYQSQYMHDIEAMRSIYPKTLRRKIVQRKMLGTSPE